MYKSNQQRLKSYVSERRVEEANADEHQERLYEQIAADLGQEVQATALAKMAKRVVNKFGEEIQMPSEKLKETGNMAASDYIREAIASGSLDKLFHKITNLDPKVLRGKARLIWKDLNDPTKRKMITNAFNESVNEILKEDIPEKAKKKAIDEAFVQCVAGNKENMNEVLKHLDEDKTRKRSNTADTNHSSEDGANRLFPSNSRKQLDKAPRKPTKGKKSEKQHAENMKQYQIDMEEYNLAHPKIPKVRSSRKAKK